MWYDRPYIFCLDYVTDHKQWQHKVLTAEGLLVNKRRPQTQFCRDRLDANCGGHILPLAISDSVHSSFVSSAGQEPA